MSWSSSIRIIRNSSVFVLGTILLGLTIASAFSSGGTVEMIVVQNSLPVVLTVGTMALGLRIYRTTKPSQSDRVLLWSLIGGLVTVLVTDWIIFVESTAGQTVSHPVHLLVSAVSFGCLVGGMFGVYSVRLHERTRELGERTEELLERNDRLDEFSRIVSHDLRNPLTVAKGHLQLAESSGDSKHFRAIDRSHARMERLIDEVRSFALHGVSMQEPGPVHLAAVATDAWRTTATSEGTLEIESNRVVVADERRVRSLLENLFRNAVVHGGDDVTVTVGSTDEGFFVSDTGPGIPPEEREHVFEAGYSPGSDGTGMGLSIVRSIADSHEWGCRIAESESGGTRFEFTGVAERQIDVSPSQQRNRSTSGSRITGQG